MKSGDEHEEKTAEPTVAKNLLAGAISGAVAKTTIAPLDRAKIHYQVHAHREYSLHSALRFVGHTYERHGFLAMYRGNSATMARVVPQAAIQFAAYERYKKLLRVDEDGSRTPIRRLLVGSMAASTATVITYPLDTARARLAVSGSYEYKNIISVFVKCHCREKLRKLYRGLSTTLLGVVPYAGLSFYTYQTLKLSFTDNLGLPVTSPWRLLFGGISGLIGQSCTYPLDIARRRMQTGRIPKGCTTFRLLALIYQKEGIRGGLYKGLTMNWLKGPVAVAVSFTTYETVRDLLMTDGIYS